MCKAIAVYAQSTARQLTARQTSAGLGDRPPDSVLDAHRRMQSASRPGLGGYTYSRLDRLARAGTRLGGYSLLDSRR